MNLLDLNKLTTHSNVAKIKENRQKFYNSSKDLFLILVIVTTNLGLFSYFESQVPFFCYQCRPSRTFFLPKTIPIRLFHLACSWIYCTIIIRNAKFCTDLGPNIIIIFFAKNILECVHSWIYGYIGILWKIMSRKFGENNSRPYHHLSLIKKKYIFWHNHNNKS